MACTAKLNLPSLKQSPSFTVLTKTHVNQYAVRKTGSTRGNH